MSQIGARFARLQRERKKGLIVYVMAGDPSMEATGDILREVARAGADIIELGVPFSDPLADGPVIQRAAERALRAGGTLRKVLAALPSWREGVAAPIVLFSYYNPILQYGLEAFAADARMAGADGVLAVDLAPEEAEIYLNAMRKEGLDRIFLGSPTSSDERLRLASSVSSGFFYIVSRTGVTGERQELAKRLSELVGRARAATSLPLAVGFGISNPDQVREVQKTADAAVVGSAVVHAIEERYSTGGAREIGNFVRWLKRNAGDNAA